jgi:hypothetical protein
VIRITIIASAHALGSIHVLCFLAFLLLLLNVREREVPEIAALLNEAKEIDSRLKMGGRTFQNMMFSAEYSARRCCEKYSRPSGW